MDTSSNYRDSNEILELNEWHHIVQKWDGSNLYLYLNGNLDHSIPTSGNLASGDQPIRIGGGGIIGGQRRVCQGDRHGHGEGLAGIKSGRE